MILLAQEDMDQVEVPEGKFKQKSIILLPRQEIMQQFPLEIFQ
jgi:hypothetical protein